MTAMECPINQMRLWDDVMALGAMTDSDKPYTRRSFSPRFLEGRAWLARRFEAAGLTVRIDAAGNLIGRREGEMPDAGTIMVGSHSDTVPAGGRFDGIAGVIAALEIARSFSDRGIRLRHALEVVDFLAEEPSEFGLSCIGSRGMTGALDSKSLSLTDPAGERLDDAIDRVGGHVASLAGARRDDVRCFFELHIEQGKVLEAGRIDVGLVTGIVGIMRIEIAFLGSADHAGTTPMTMRRDALTAAAELVVAVRDEARALASSGNGYFVATTGVLNVHPNAANVVPARTSMIIEARAESAVLLGQFKARIETLSAGIANRCNVERSHCTLLSSTQPVACSPMLRALLQEAADANGLSSIDIASGAGHDAAFMSRIAPAAMVFVPCLDGRSHTPEEWAEPEALAAGTAVMCDAVLRFDQTRNENGE